MTGWGAKGGQAGTLGKKNWRRKGQHLLLPLSQQRAPGLL